MFRSNQLLHRLLLSAVLLLAYASRIWRLGYPDTYYFDEVYHAFTAKFYALNLPQAYEWWHTAPEGVAYEWLHPPIAKLFQGLSIYLLGDFSFAWRLPSVIAGVLVVAAIYQLSQILFGNRWTSLVAALFATFEGLLLVQSRIAMNDIFVTLFMLLAFISYANYRKTSPVQTQLQHFMLACVWTGLAVATKWSGAFLLGAFWVLEAIQAYQQSPKRPQALFSWLLLWWLIPGAITLTILKNITTLFSTPTNSLIAILMGLGLVQVGLILTQLKWRPGSRLLMLVGLPGMIYLASYGQFWLHDRPNNLETFRELHHQIWWYQTHLEATHPWQSQPYQWVLNLKPVWYFVDYGDTAHSNIYALGNPAIAWLGLAAMIWLAVTNLWRRSKPIWYLIFIYLVVWLPWQLSPRIMFYYHYTPATAFLCIGLAYTLSLMWISKYRWGRPLSLLTGIGVVVCGLFFYPYWTGLPIPTTWLKFYTWLPGWKP